LNQSISNEVIKWREGENGIKYPLKYSKRGYELKNFKTYLYEKRNRYFYDQFHKISKRVVEYFVKYGVTNIILSYNLADLKYNGKCKLSKRVKQNFIQIPFIKLLDYIQYKANENGIMVDCIDESYTSKTSCVSDDVNHPLDKELNGVRSKRGLFKDNAIDKVFNADLNGAVNHIKKQYNDLDFSWLKNYLFKLNNPIKIKCDYEFCKQNSVSGKEHLYSAHTSHPAQFCVGLS
jgi:IS605 OrfB family transposase